jgi:hypothetical protein
VSQVADLERVEQDFQLPQYMKGQLIAGLFGRESRHLGP